MYNITQQSGKTSAYVVSLIADYETDVMDLPIDIYAPGSNCFVIETGNVYMLSNARQWELIG